MITHLQIQTFLHSSCKALQWKTSLALVTFNDIREAHTLTIPLLMCNLHSTGVSVTTWTTLCMSCLDLFPAESTSTCSRTAPRHGITAKQQCCNRGIYMPQQLLPLKSHTHDSFPGNEAWKCGKLFTAWWLHFLPAKILGLCEYTNLIYKSGWGVTGFKFSKNQSDMRKKFSTEEGKKALK